MSAWYSRASTASCEKTEASAAMEALMTSAQYATALGAMVCRALRKYAASSRSALPANSVSSAASLNSADRAGIEKNYVSKFGRCLFFRQSTRGCVLRSLLWKESSTASVR